MLIIYKQICMKKNNFEENRTKETADEALSQKDGILLDIKNILDPEEYKISPLFIPTDLDD